MTGTAVVAGSVNNKQKTVQLVNILHLVSEDDKGRLRVHDVVRALGYNKFLDAFGRLMLKHVLSFNASCHLGLFWGLALRFMCHLYR